MDSSVNTAAKVRIFEHIRKQMCKKFCENLYFAKSGMKFPVRVGSTIGDLWEIYGLFVAFYKRVSIIMLQKSSARKVFCAEDCAESFNNQLIQDIDYSI